MTAQKQRSGGTKTPESAGPDSASPESPRGATRGLVALGLSEAQAGAYEVLIDHPGATAGEVARALGLSRRSVEQIMSYLEHTGLAVRSAERTPRYSPMPPDVAIDALVTKRQEELQSVRALAVNLNERARKAAHADEREEQVVEILMHTKASSSLFGQIHEGARREVVVIEKPPYVMRAPLEGNPELVGALRRKVRFRRVLAAAALEVPGRLASLREHIAAGEEARVLPTVPVKLLAVDRRLVLVTLRPEQPAPAALLVRPSSLLDALYELFEMLWERATPIRFSESSGEKITEEVASGTSSESQRMIALLTAGLNDKSIAHQLGISPRTLDRRIEALLTRLNARTRFQAGWMAALRLPGKPNGRR